MTIKVDRNGKIIIPKELREKYNLSHGIELEVAYKNGELIFTPIAVCSVCGKALSKDQYKGFVCSRCTLPEGRVIQIY